MTTEVEQDDASQENTILGGMTGAAAVAQLTGAIEQDGIPVSATVTGRTELAPEKRILPCHRTVKGSTGPVKSEITDGIEVFIHEKEEAARKDGRRKYLRSGGIVEKAMGKLEGWKFIPSKITSSAIPVDIVAFRGREAVLVQAISSRGPVPDAKTLERLHHDDVDNLRRMGTSAQFRKVVMVYSGQCGWKVYDVLPGGLIPAWSLADVPGQ